MIPLDALAHRERALQASRGEPAVYPFSLAEVLDSSEQALRRVAAVGWLRTLERFPQLTAK
ncbi:hypothetical protein SAMN05216553_11349 [Lentzea fradiae]|uniref:Uncharacterized protein n=1 Tax=Lentzea fradiae TaxID=200378 RepID=A0A1G7Y2I2_9PSEU|nr:hypothetical protein [Lentzea fradiae]SDG90641.1 hypothetical protein SAMN05216553_11349 [Lentzea fradiae]